MNHFASPSFWVCYDKLPSSIKKLANKNFELLKSNPNHPSLHFKKVDRYWSVRVGRKYRAIAIEDMENIIWFWIGSHADYNDLIK